MFELLAVLGGVLLLSLVVAVGLVTSRGRRPAAPPRPQPGVDYRPGTGDDAEVPRDTPLRGVDTVGLPDDAGADEPVLPRETLAVDPVAPQREVPAPTAGRLARLRSRLARSQSTLGRGLFALLTRDTLDEIGRAHV